MREHLGSSLSLMMLQYVVTAIVFMVFTDLEIDTHCSHGLVLQLWEMKKQ